VPVPFAGKGALLDCPAIMRSIGPRKTRVLIAAVVVVVAASLLIWLGFGRGAVYYYSVSELKALGAADQVRVSGRLQGGTLVRQGGTHFTFTIHDRENLTDAIPVTYDGALPDTFKDAPEVEVVLEGEQRADGTFLAQTFIAKCPSKYEAAP
jgi:cytochrome c-type biogenesis protein CcmE